MPTINRSASSSRSHECVCNDGWDVASAVLGVACVYCSLGQKSFVRSALRLGALCQAGNVLYMAGHAQAGDARCVGNRRLGCRICSGVMCMSTLLYAFLVALLSSVMGGGLKANREYLRQIRRGLMGSAAAMGAGVDFRSRSKYKGA